jgi:hypothetical protein
LHYNRGKSGNADRNKSAKLENGSFLFRGISKKIDKAERDKCQHQNNDKENEAAYDAILETLSARDFYAIKYPVGHKVEAASDQCVVYDFHVNAPSIVYARTVYYAAGLCRDGFNQLFQLCC